MFILKKEASLNRTSVGLKLSLTNCISARRVCLNRTSVGLKPGDNSTLGRAENAGLNRTSVGLKQYSMSGRICQEGSPQSNQRGIETGGRVRDLYRAAMPQSNQRGIETFPSPPLSRMNRTRPQSNQRGIETTEHLDGLWLDRQASIEPAWD